MSLSDYGYATSANNRYGCIHSNPMYQYANNGCMNDNWIYHLEPFGFPQWVINPLPGTNNSNLVFRITDAGGLGNKNASDTSSVVRPSVYIARDVVLTGEGSYDNPYQVVSCS